MVIPAWLGLGASPPNAKHVSVFSPSNAGAWAEMRR